MVSIRPIPPLSTRQNTLDRCVSSWRSLNGGMLQDSRLGPVIHSLDQRSPSSVWSTSICGRHHHVRTYSSILCC